MMLQMILAALLTILLLKIIAQKLVALAQLETLLLYMRQTAQLYWVPLLLVQVAHGLLTLQHLI